MKKQEGFEGQRSYSIPQDILAIAQTHPLVENLFITDIGFYPNATFHDRERNVGCAQHILIYCTEGEGWYEINQQKYFVKANHFFILPASIAHAYGANIDKPWSIYWVHFTGNRSDYFVNFLLDNTMNNSPMLIPPNHERLLMFNDILAHIEMSFNDDNIVYANTRFAHFLVTFKSAVFMSNAFTKSQADPISKTIAYMKEHLTEQLTLEDLAAVAGMSPSHFSAIFRQKVQRSPINFFTFLKVQQACYWLEYSKLRIKEIAYQIGYSDPYHFSRVFVTVMGKSPRAFRNMDKID